MPRTPRLIEEGQALEHLAKLMAFAFEQGYHEIGYDPVQVLRNALKKPAAATSERLFCELPLGTRFSYPGSADVWVVLERHGYGLIAKWEGADGPVAGQTICAAEDTREVCLALKVLVNEAV